MAKNVSARKAKNSSWKKASSSAKKSGLSVSALVSKRKTLKKGSKEYNIVQNRINKAYGSKKVHGKKKVTKKKVLKKPQSLTAKKRPLAGKAYTYNTSNTLKKVVKKKKPVQGPPKPKNTVPKKADMDIRKDVPVKKVPAKKKTKKKKYNATEIRKMELAKRNAKKNKKNNVKKSSGKKVPKKGKIKGKKKTVAKKKSSGGTIYTWLSGGKTAAQHNKERKDKRKKK